MLRAFEGFLGLRTGTLGLVSGLANRSITAEEAKTIRAYNLAHSVTRPALARHSTPWRCVRRRPVPVPPRAVGGQDHDPAALVGPRAGGGEGRSDRQLASRKHRACGSSGDLGCRCCSSPTRPGPKDEAMPKDVPPEVAPRIAMGILVASGRTRIDGAIDDNELDELMSAVANRQLMAALGARSRATLARTAARASVAVELGVDRARARVRPGKDAGDGAGPRPRSARQWPCRALLASRILPEERTSVAATPSGSIVIHVSDRPRRARRPFRQRCTPAAMLWRRRACIIKASDDIRSRRYRPHSSGDRFVRLRSHLSAIGTASATRSSSRAQNRVVLSSEFFTDATTERIRGVVEELGNDRVPPVVTLASSSPPRFPALAMAAVGTERPACRIRPLARRHAQQATG